jgi:hypothetical protein
MQVAAAAAAWVAMVVTITVLSFLPVSVEQLPGQSRSWFDIGHALAYGLHALLLLWLLLAAWRTLGYVRAAAVSAAGTLALSGVIELFQPLLGRSRDLGDLAMNAVGILVALGLLSLLRGRALVNE